MELPAPFRSTITRMSRILPFLATLFLLSLFTACQSARHPASFGLTPSKQPKPAFSASDLEKRIHTLINRERTAQGLSPLARDEPLARVARGHSKDMAVRGYFSHDSPEGSDFSFRYKADGYTCKLRVGNTIHTGAENIALGHLYSSIRTVNGIDSYDWLSLDQIAHQTVQGWMNSPGHRKNILTSHWMNQGIGVFISTDGKVYITQNFC